MGTLSQISTKTEGNTVIQNNYNSTADVYVCVKVQKKIRTSSSKQICVIFVSKGKIRIRANINQNKYPLTIRIWCLTQSEKVYYRVIHLQHSNTFSMHNSQTRPPSHHVIRKTPRENYERVPGRSTHKNKMVAMLEASKSTRTCICREEIGILPISSCFIFHFKNGFTRLWLLSILGLFS